MYIFIETESSRYFDRFQGFVCQLKTLCWHSVNARNRKSRSYLVCTFAFIHKARVKRRTSHVPNLILMSKILNCSGLPLDWAHVKFDV